jgi:predicted dithiol-disulfide oxidoreductase (DUF899 family)
MAAVKKVNHDDWLEARIALLKKEKEFTKLRDAMTKMQRELPWERVEKDYVFDGPNGKESLAELFGSCSQLLVYHFMFDPSWDEGCKSCSFLADHYNPATAHLAQRDVVMVTISRAPLEKLEAFKSRMEELESGSAYYNYRGGAKFPANEGPGLSVFAKDDKGDVFHTYSSYGRGLDMFITAYNFLDIVPKGRDEAGLSYSMEWIRHHDRYDDASFVDPYLPD